ncbi:Translin-associated factor X-interacting protein 1 [Trypanosoma melophagium]|uniref:Translin-associated factor X-interacting protein 1 n=1 Tax=Trypanosoma melophagium TaxID=715481 RepID=UPI00351A5230|nr:Translin-associated factor X-interacting protein 1 [Trypanosoma melophagium]
MLHTGSSVTPSRTLSLTGMQHITSPSVPSVVLGDKHLPEVPYNPVPRPESRQALSLNLRDIVPSARLLLKSHDKNTPRSGGVHKSKSSINGKIGTIAGQFVGSRAAATTSPIKGSSTATPESCATDGKKTTSSPLPNFQTVAFSKDVSEKAMNLTKKLNQTYSGTKTISNTTMNRTFAKPMLPPLATALEHYVQRELGILMDETGILTAQERLPPFREAFFSFIDAFPAYGKILNDIMSAYDSVIQEQAKMLTEMMSKQTERQIADEQHSIEVDELNKTILKLSEELEETRGALEERELVLPVDDDPAAASRPRTQRSGRIFADMEKMLREAKRKIAILEENNKSDLEKHLVLIAALRESDKRSKVLELQLATANAKAEELDDFKIMAGEAQKQLEEFKLKYQNYISVKDYELMKEYLTGELQAAQNLVKQYRRSAAVRGTQVDVIGRKMKTLQDEKIELLEVVEDERRQLLTPRPDWKKIHSLLPDLGENSSPIEAIPIEGDIVTTSTIQGPNETRLQVEYLVERINSLNKELQRRSMIPLPVKNPEIALIGQGVGSCVPRHLRASGIIPRVKLDTMEVLHLVHDFFNDVLRPHPDALLYTLDVPTLYLGFLKKRIETKEELKHFLCPEHLAINLADMAKDREHCRPSLYLLDGILSGIFPARIACDVIIIIENVRYELKELSEAQKKTRLRRTAVSDCVSPVLQLKSAEEVALIKEALGADTSHDVTALTSTTGKFISTLLDQECASGMKFYATLLDKLTSYAHYLEEEGGDLVINLDDVGRAITEVEPLTPKPVIKEITQKSSDNNFAEEEQRTRLSDVVHALAAAPVIRRSPQQKAASSSRL